MPLTGQFPDHVEGVIEVAVQHDHLGPEEHGLGQLAHGHLARGEEDDAAQPGLGGIGGEGGGGVPGGCATHLLATQLHRPAHADGHASVLEGASGVGPFELDEDLLDAGLLGQGLALVQRGAAFLQRDRLGPLHRQQAGRNAKPPAVGRRTLGPSAP